MIEQRDNGKLKYRAVASLPVSQNKVWKAKIGVAGIYSCVGNFIFLALNLLGGFTILVINEIPLIFRKEIYAMACVVGGIAYWLCDVAGLESYACQLIGGSAVFLTRILAVKYHICLPILKGGEDIKEDVKEE